MRNGRSLRSAVLVAAGVVVGAGGTAFLLSPRSDSPMEAHEPAAMTGMAEDVQGELAGGERRILYWRAPMDPSYTSDRPGKSPMGMDLVPVYEDEVLEAAGAVGAPGARAGTGSIRVSQAFLQNFAVRTTDVRRGALPVSIRTVGILAHNEERVVSVQTKYEGWIEQASVNNVGETVASGDVLFEIYSPQLVTTQREFLGAMDYVRRLRGGGAYPEAIERAESLVEAARERLLYWDMTEAQIDALTESQTVTRTVPVFSPATGFIVEKLSDSMEGMKLDPGMTVLKIADHSTLWAETEFYEDDLRHVHEGQAVTVEADAFPGEEWNGRILFFRPAVNPQTRTLTAFVDVANPDLLLRPMMYVNVTVRTSGAVDAVMVPTEAVLHSGARAVVIVARGGGVFEPREVVLGTESEGMQEVAAGLAEGESIVVSSQFLIDSDANLRAAISQLLSGAEAAGRMSGHEPANARDSAGATDTMPHRH
ncbi:MAG: efflux RND transporter periplasmic adaptor subunit [Gemmatimonadota bacterium]|nr:efflux RND transporter periplasmic adaptor subunit [Gemmatimonadota bacterium]MDE2865630.1 efflux RND transporter periplasmic adaptor subunit [Gemmatimonadota bacterium]MYB06255.1 efflux RND transporter periplasmic adaptor subunit [Gemmatimonadota bacterium]MYG22996.1 efflux RND transporter periplasmic adaptor subunit [Gemmatimonadota bacterium]MYJ40085.1 efflux RND transporter periplasmic adaptor subunit [Gemmatimonadota bacterium]